MKKWTEKDERRLEWRIAFGAVITAFIWVVLAAMALAATLADCSASNLPTENSEPSESLKTAVAAVHTSEPSEPAESIEPECPYTDQHMEMLAMVIYQEAGGDACSDETRRMVGEVVLNRMADPRYPDAMYEVLSEPYQFGRLAWRFDWPERAQLPEEANAVDRAYHIAILVLTSEERLLPEDTVFLAEFPQGVETVIEQDGIYFCK